MNEIVYKSISYCKQSKYNEAYKILISNINSACWKEKLIFSSIASYKNNNKKLNSYSKEITKILPESRFAFNNLGNNYFYFNKINLAIKAYEAAIDKNENEIDLIESLSKFHKKLLLYFKLIKKKINNDKFIFIFSKFLFEINYLREKLALRQVLTKARPHFANLFNELELLLIKIDSIYKNKLSIKKDFLKKKLLKKNILDLLTLKKEFIKVSKINADYENPYFNLAKCYLKKKNLYKAIKFLKLANNFNKNNKFDSKILEILYISKQKRKFINFSKNFKNKKKINFDSLAICQMASEQLNIKNNFIFCESPLKYIYQKNIINSKEVNKNYLNDIEKEIKKNRNKTFTPVVIGYKSIGNIFDENSKNILKLKKIIIKSIKDFKKKFSNSSNILINKFPKNYDLNGWYISLKKGGEVTSHIHDGWLSGVFYIKKGLKNKKNINADIELSTRYQKLPIIKKNYSKKLLETNPGDLILFPSSLPHRVMPFNLNKERLSIAFDMKLIK